MTNRRAVLAFGILGGIALVALAVVGPFGGALARAESAPLALDIYTADSQGLGVTSTLIYGDQEAILVDTQFRIADAEKLAERIAAKGRKLKAILITHPHFDHFYGASVLLKRFPGTPVYASPSDIEYIKGSLANTVAQMRARFGEAIPADIQIPQPWPDTHFTVDGQAVEVVAGLQGDVGPGPRNNVVWVPSLAAAIVGDIAFNQVHRSGPPMRIPARPGRRRCVSSRSGIPALWWPDTRATPGSPTRRTCSLSTGRTSPSSRLPWPPPTTRASSWPR